MQKRTYLSPFKTDSPLAVNDNGRQKVDLSKNNIITYKDSNDINVTKTDSNRYNTMFEDNGDNGNCTSSSSGNLEEREYKTTCKWSYNRNNKNKVCIKSIHFIHTYFCGK